MTQRQLLHSQNSLLSWYVTDARSELPWRKTSNIYHIYLSEVMLQQTQVSRVEAEYYPRFLKIFPTLESLSKASLDEVFSLWSGLGYYRRAKNLHATAQLCPDGLPNTSAELEKLPGIGRYTASAICSFGYKQSVSVVDTNIARVLARFFAKVDVKDKELWVLADNYLNLKSATEHNLALMDLGAMICTPKNPKCDICPLITGCIGKENPALYYKKKKITYVDKELHHAICIEDNAIAMVKSKEGMYKDMLELPSLEAHKHEDTCLGTFKHSVTHFRLKVFVYLVEDLGEDITWVALDSIASAPISSLTQKAFAMYEKSVA
ncbi:MAG: A/G-specific adenine glycosylase [Sulfurimonas sp.]|uniref:A/G-specific adenine glycosylase n=1 Tax=Sulfurimonas sp. TaxID=2022749 RepID=UPI0039E29D95